VTAKAVHSRAHHQEGNHLSHCTNCKGKVTAAAAAAATKAEQRLKMLAAAWHDVPHPACCLHNIMACISTLRSNLQKLVRCALSYC
jgi:hypothetical protein